MRQIVNSFIKKHSLLQKDATVVVGVSGGADSLALLHFLIGEAYRLNLKIVAAHVDHMLRGQQSEEDYCFVESFCIERKIFFEGTRIDVASYQKMHKVSVQVAARNCRYEFFQKVMEKYDASFLALAHHGDDQVETMLMRQIRGAYGLGLAGIPIKRKLDKGEIIRPFLCVSKDEIEAYCFQENLLPRIDKSNFSRKYLRNRIRNDVLPILKKENPAVHTRFQQQSELLTDDENYLVGLAKVEIKKVIESRGTNSCQIKVSNFNQIPIPLQRRGFQLILNYLYRSSMPQISTVHMDEFLHLMKTSQPSGYLHFPNGLIIKKSYDVCSFSFDNKSQTEAFHLLLSIPGIVTFKKGKIYGEVVSSIPPLANKKVAVFDVDKVVFPLMVRTRQDGDRLSLEGVRGSKKLKALFIDKKVPRDERNQWPIVVDGNNEIIWVPGIKRSSLAQTTDKTTHFLILNFDEFNE